MGDIAEAMLDGDLCEQCGEYVGPGEGYAQLCGACEDERQRREQKPESAKTNAAQSLAAEVKRKRKR